MAQHWQLSHSYFLQNNIEHLNRYSAYATGFTEKNDGHKKRVVQSKQYALFMAIRQKQVRMYGLSLY